ncbi:hypothetical protein H8R29_11655 [Priestia megaterium]|uniref:Uncharacterized protein n=1 Tax=Priestia megaterium (strain ATCC 14581 / DSM 32 / CCUG 1817 / JCM 2506 / NBRC 15308 / NCIMB 9376 / NCTC 10342 / NRRL B-14308 / VKM B-512 / Ford 19) TaxID=1348623 RepID=A0A0B6AN45_PRIM2|nr:hypothetical protein [Priestia megaterium]AJI21264.1 hypothetical protein BG04_4619 [Priestia megaterium NBRC 15308 = ATCC 14581]KFM97434.1 hypothetical protein DJ91_650 [Priestia megaterium]KGJ73904.1 hypothetical protein BMT_05860 [Priestia megaterium NBRC 15308 = ATCC 14581]MDR4231369.1 hypothetical protein [Priestia megaterium]MED3807636.1 hypothetical protein [Priestia megaterium]
MIVEWDVAKRDSTTVRTIITADVLVRKDVTSMTTMVTADALAKKDATSMMTTTMATANALARKNAISMTGMRKNIIVKTTATMITA